MIRIIPGIRHGMFPWRHTGRGVRRFLKTSSTSDRVHGVGLFVFVSAPSQRPCLQHACYISGNQVSSIQDFCCTCFKYHAYRQWAALTCQYFPCGAFTPVMFKERSWRVSLQIGLADGLQSCSRTSSSSWVALYSSLLKRQVRICVVCSNAFRVEY